MRNLLIFFFSSLLCYSAFSWDITDKNKKEEYVRWFESIKEKYNNKNFKKNLKDNIDVEQDDTQAIGDTIRLTGDLAYIRSINLNLESFNEMPKLPSSTPPIFRKLLIYLYDINTESAEKMKENYYELATKVEQKEIKIQEVVKNLDIILAAYTTEMDNNQKEFTKMKDEIEKGKTPNFAKSNNKRDLAKNDVIAQALNYSVGVPEDAQGPNFFYPIDTTGGKCIYGITSDDSQMGQFSQSILGAVESMMPILNSAGIQVPNTSTTFDLSKVDFSTTAYYKKNGVTPKTKYSAGTPYLKYQVKVDGLPDLFECDSNVCNLERLQRAWKLIAKTCVGIKKPF